MLGEGGDAAAPDSKAGVSNPGILARVDSLERNVRGLTGDLRTVEGNLHVVERNLHAVEENFAAFKLQFEALKLELELEKTLRREYFDSLLNSDVLKDNTGLRTTLLRLQEKMEREVKTRNGLIFSGMETLKEFFTKASNRVGVKA